MQVVLGVVLTVTAQAGLTPVDLRCDFMVEPLGVDSQTPWLSWKLEGGGKGAKQSAYEIVASPYENGLTKNENAWDTGKVDSDETLQIPMTSPLKSGDKIYWHVKVWDANGNVSKWSKTATWTMGMTRDFDWRSKWIGAADTNIPSLLLRRQFNVEDQANMKRALITICGLGQYELTINGKKIGNDFLTPGWTKYDKTCLYDTYDVTAALQQGANTIGIELGNGMYNVLGGGRFTKFKGSFGPQKAIAQIRMDYTGGWTKIVGTDNNWRLAPGPITFNSIYGGEDFDARKVQAGWNENDFDDAKWAHVVETDGPGGKLRGLSCAAPPIRKFEVHEPVNKVMLTNGDMVYDLGQNAAHVPEIHVTGPAGSVIRIIPSELTSPDDSANQSSMGAGHRGTLWCEYTKGTANEEAWSPKFFYVGCRYLQVHCQPAEDGGEAPRVKSIDGVVVQSSSEPVGEFECSSPLFNSIRTLVRWAQRANMMSILTDCPHRERLGWLEQDHLNGPSLRYEFEMAPLFTKTLNDIADSQLTNGLVPTTAPEYTIFRDKNDTKYLRNAFGDSPEWGAAFILIPWQQYIFDGDLTLFRSHYDAMKDYLKYLGTRADKNIVNYGLGDWYDLGPKKPGVSQLTPIALTATAFYYQDTVILAHVAELLGKGEDAKQFSTQAANIRAAFNAKFYNPTNQSYATGSQCANAIPLVMGLCEDSNRAMVVDAIVQDVRAHDNGLTAGDVGYRYLLRALADGRRSDVIFDINNQTNKPGYGMQLAKGKTSLTEAWDGGSSQDHFMLGQIEEWFYHDLAGIQSDGDGFKAITINPQPVGDLKWVKASYDSLRGQIVSNWKRDDRNFTLDVTIPPNTTATVYVLAKSAKDVKADSGAKLLRMEDGRAVYAVGAGEYEFRSKYLNN